MLRDKLFFFLTKKMIKIKKTHKQNKKKHVQYNKYDFLFGKKEKITRLELEIKVAVVRQ